MLILSAKKLIFPPLADVKRLVDTLLQHNKNLLCSLRTNLATIPKTFASPTSRLCSTAHQHHGRLDLRLRLLAELLLVLHHRHL